MERHQREDAQDRIRRVFRFIRERADLDAPVPREIPDDWTLLLGQLPQHPSVRTTSAVGDDSDGVVLRVLRAKTTDCPAPPPVLADWVLPGWERVDATVETVPTRNLPRGSSGATAQTVSERFDASSERTAALTRWLEVRETWRAAEEPARAAVTIYERLFGLRARLLRESERVRLVIGDGWLRWNHTAGKVDHPILLQDVELDFDATAPAVVVKVVGSPELHMPLLRQFTEIDSQQFVAARDLLQRDDLWMLDTASVADALDNACNVLFARGAFDRTGRVPASGERPVVAQQPILFLMRRAGAVQEAADRLVEALPKLKELPLPLVRVVMDIEDTTVSPEGPTPERGSHKPRVPVEPLFTLPANKEQSEIVQRYARDGSVVVQGPPGTGKTHTIANLIGHLLAEGKTVLVTSHTTKALRVLRDKVVPQLQPLCVNLLESDLRGREQLEASINGIVARLSRPDGDSEERVHAATTTRADLARALEAAERALEQATNSEVTPIVVGGRSISPSDAAKFIRDSAADDWIPGPVARASAPSLSDEEIAQLYALQTQVDPSSEQEFGFPLPRADQLPAGPEFSELVTRIVGSEKLPWRDADARWRQAEVDLRGAEAALAEATGAIAWLTDERWLSRCIGDTRRGAEHAQVWKDLLVDIDRTLVALSHAYPVEMRHKVTLGDLNIADAHSACLEIIDHLETQGTLNWFALIKKKGWRELRDGSAIDDARPEGLQHFESLGAVLSAKVALADLSGRWERQMSPLEVGPVPVEHAAAVDFLKRFQAMIKRALVWLHDEWQTLERRFDQLGLVMSQLSTARQCEPGEVVSRAQTAVRVDLRAAVHAAGLRAQREKHRKKLLELAGQLGDGQPAPQGPTVQRLLTAVRRGDATAYAAELARLKVLHQSKHAFELRNQLLAKLERTAPAWAGVIRVRAPKHGGANPPGNAARAWQRRQLQMELIDRHALDINALQERVHQLRSNLNVATAVLVETLAWRNQGARTTPTQRRNLTGWVDYQKQIGRGTGKRAPRLQRQAQKVLSECRGAVPVWIMPLSRVVTTYDVTDTQFDVVIIDEASQCDVDGLFAFALARSVIVVGDDQQVSPLAVGENVDKVQVLIDQYLTGIPNKDLFTGRLSVYDLARQSQTAIRLQEHFRCVPEIIAFSSKLSYGGEIQPLRDASDVRLRPHVIDHVVRDGVREEATNTNPKEAIEVASLIAACCEQPEYASATMGVISLLGDLQWELVERLLHARMPASDVERRRLVCGNPSHFQGDERDVMFLSLVWSSTGKPLTLMQSPEFKKRLNVATSRARDQMWVVHSLNPDVDLQAADLRLPLLRHAQNPAALVEELRGASRVESEFERRVLAMLQTRQYRIQPQWAVGAYRIDLVALGRDGRKVAIECDGEKWHSTKDQLAMDRYRQEQLERCGWRFVRVRGSEFFMNAEKAIDRVCARLNDLDIEPLGPGGGAAPNLPEGHALRRRVVSRAEELRVEFAVILERTNTPPKRRRFGKPAIETAAPASGSSSVPANPPASVIQAPAATSQLASRPDAESGAIMRTVEIPRGSLAGLVGQKLFWAARKASVTVVRVAGASTVEVQLADGECKVIRADLLS